jgi:signal transduction histidine kinase
MWGIAEGEQGEVTADSLPLRTAATSVEPEPAADAHMISELLAETSRHARVSPPGHSLRLGLEAVERAFGRQILDPRARSGVEAARERVLMLAEFGGELSPALALSFASDAFVSLAVERTWPRHDVARLVPSLGRLLGCTAEEVRLQLLVGALRAPQLLELPPQVAIEVQLSILIALAPVQEASLWTRDASGRPECVASIGTASLSRRVRLAAREALEGRAQTADRSLIVGAPVRRWQTPFGALVVRLRARDDVNGILAEAASAMSPLLERESLLERSAAREHSLVNASERRLSRLGFDLHDGALQHVAALSTDVRRLGAEVPEALESSVTALGNRVAELDRVLRELAHSLEPASLLRRPLEEVIETEAAALEERTGMQVRTSIAGSFGGMTPSQRIAVIRVAQETLTNVREHSNATFVDVRLVGSRSCVELEIEDDGDGFEVARTLQDAAQRGRLGLVGSGERVRLLGGRFDIRSRPGGPTTVSVNLARWQPLAAEASAQLAY